MSLLLCVTVVAVWVRSYWRSQYVYYVRMTPEWDGVRSLRLFFQVCKGAAVIDVENQHEGLGEGATVEKAVGREWGLETREAQDPIIRAHHAWGGFAYEMFPVPVDARDTGGALIVESGFRSGYRRPCALPGCDRLLLRRFDRSVPLNGHGAGRPLREADQKQPRQQWQGERRMKRRPHK